MMMSVLSTATFAGEILLTANEAHEVVYRIAHKNETGPIVLGELEKTNLRSNLHVKVKRHGFDYAGIVIYSVDGHVLPSFTNAFPNKYQCSIALNKEHGAGALEISMDPHKITCETYGGIYG